MEEANYFQSQIGVLQWMVKINQTDIITEVSMLASKMAMPRKGHLKAVFCVFVYLNNHHNSHLVFNLCYPSMKESDFIECDWTEMYEDVREPIPPNAPEPRGCEVELQMYVDADHAGDQKIRRSQSGFII